MSVDIPRPSGVEPVVVSSSSGENTLTHQGNPASEYIEANVSTYVAVIPVSEQALTRQQGKSLSNALFSQAGREISTALDQALALAVVTNAQQFASSASSLTTENLWSDVGTAASLAMNQAGTRLVPSHVFAPSKLLTFVLSEVDGQHRPIWLPRGGDEAVSAGRLENYVGADCAGFAMFYEDNLPQTSGSASYVLVGNPGLALAVYSGELVVETFPTFQAGAQGLTNLVRFRQYMVPVILLPDAFVAISSADGGYPLDPRAV